MRFRRTSTPLGPLGELTTLSQNPRVVGWGGNASP